MGMQVAKNQHPACRQSTNYNPIIEAIKMDQHMVGPTMMKCVQPPLVSLHCTHICSALMPMQITNKQHCMLGQLPEYNPLNQTMVLVSHLQVSPMIGGLLEM